jgi:hypothetical protein
MIDAAGFEGELEEIEGEADPSGDLMPGFSIPADLAVQPIVPMHKISASRNEAFFIHRISDVAAGQGLSAV